MSKISILGFFSNRGFLLPNERSWHAGFIGNLAKALRPKSYLEVGVYKGETFRKVSAWATHSVGVDINPEVVKSIGRIRNSTFCTGSLEKVLPQIREFEPFDLVFIDADHSKESVLLDFRYARDLLSTKGLVLLHDTWPKSLEFSQPELCGDAWQAVSELRVTHPDWSFVTIPAHPGLTLCQRNDSTPL